jgi:hypothetical protein
MALVPRQNGQQHHGRRDERPDNPLVELRDAVTAIADEPCMHELGTAGDRHAVGRLEQERSASAASTALIEPVRPFLTSPIEIRDDRDYRNYRHRWPKTWRVLGHLAAPILASFAFLRSRRTSH